MNAKTQRPSVCNAMETLVVHESIADEFLPLVNYIASLEETRAMDLSLVLPGHGEPITDHAGLIDERFRLHRRRAEKIRRLIASEPRTAHEVAQELWGNVAVTQAFLTLSEVLGHVDLLLAEGLVIEQEDDGVVRFAAGELALRLSASTLASFQRRAPPAVGASRHSAARTRSTLLAAMEAPVPVQQHTTACCARPSATSRAAASEAHAQSFRSRSLSAP